MKLISKYQLGTNQGGIRIRTPQEIATEERHKQEAAQEQQRHQNNIWRYVAQSLATADPAAAPAYYAVDENKRDAERLHEEMTPEDYKEAGKIGAGMAAGLAGTSALGLGVTFAPMATAASLGLGYGVDKGTQLLSGNRYSGWGDMLAQNIGGPEWAWSLSNPGYLVGPWGFKLLSRSNLGRALELRHALNQGIRKGIRSSPVQVPEPQLHEVVDLPRPTKLSLNPIDRFEASLELGSLDEEPVQSLLRTVDSHGITKGNELEHLENILQNGFNNNKTLYTAGLSRARYFDVNGNQIGYGSGSIGNSSVRDGMFILNSKPGGSLKDGIENVLINTADPEYAKALQLYLQSKYPNIKFLLYNEAPEYYGTNPINWNTSVVEGARPLNPFEQYSQLYNNSSELPPPPPEINNLFGYATDNERATMEGINNLTEDALWRMRRFGTPVPEYFTYTPTIRVGDPTSKFDAIQLKRNAGAWFTPATNTVTLRGALENQDFGLVAHEVVGHGLRHNLHPDYKPISKMRYFEEWFEKQGKDLSAETIDALKQVHIAPEFFTQKEQNLLLEAYPWVKDFFKGQKMSEQQLLQKVLDEAGAINTQFRSKLSKNGKITKEALDKVIDKTTDEELLKMLIDQPYSSSIVDDFADPDLVATASTSELKKLITPEIKAQLDKVRYCLKYVGMMAAPAAAGLTD